MALDKFFIHINLFVFTILLSLMAPSSQATIIGMGDEIFDSRTGLKWLNLRETRYFGYEKVKTSILDESSIFYGYRVASLPEVESLLFDSFGFGDDTDEGIKARYFLSLFDSTDGPEECCPWDEPPFSFREMDGYSDSDILSTLKDISFSYLYYVGAGYTLTDRSYELEDGSYMTIEEYDYAFIEYRASSIYDPDTGMITGFTEEPVHHIGSGEGASLFEYSGGERIGWYLVKDASYLLSEPSYNLLLAGLLILITFRKNFKLMYSA